MAKILDSRGMKILTCLARARIEGRQYVRPASTPGGSNKYSVNGKRINERGLKVLIALMIATIDKKTYQRPA